MQQKDKTKSLASLILGLLFWVPLFNLFFGIIGLVMGLVALKEIKSNPNEHAGIGMALAGIVMCCIPILGGLFLLIEFLFL